MKILGVDYGTKRIGLAITDENHRLSFPKEIILNNKDTIKTLREILKNEKIGEIVIGESMDFSGKLNAISAQIEVFILELKEKFNLPIHKQKEFLTSVEARKMGTSKKSLHKSNAHTKISKVKKWESARVDAQAAALILQRYLDKRNLINKT